ncbi:MAG: alpha/beta fold hydrolase [Sphingobium sp.]
MRRHAALFLPIILLTIGIMDATARASGPARVTTPRGAAIEVIAEKPAGKGPFPAVILAAGSAYDMRRPIIEQVARALLGQGIAVYRFDWAYQVAGTPFAAQPKDRLAEMEDMRTALALAEKDADIDHGRIAVAGKSLGSVIAWQVLRAAPEVKGALLLTPVCAPGNAAADHYPGLSGEDRPRLWIIGDADPVCPLPLWERFIAEGGKGERIAVISGDHVYRTAGVPERDARAADLLARLAADFAATLLAPAAR